jgi:hypothetical protein
MKAQTMRRLRQIHHYVGVFFAPAIIFFAFTGMLQVIGLQEKSPSGPPPAWINWAASIHKHQVPPKPRPAGGDHGDDHGAGHRPAAGPEAGGHEHEHGGFVPLKAFVLLVALGLLLSSIVGVIIALNNRATRRTSVVMLVAGVVLPLLLMLA